ADYGDTVVDRVLNDRPSTGLIFDWGRPRAGRLRLPLRATNRPVLGALYLGLDAPPDPERDRPAALIVAPLGADRWSMPHPARFRYALVTDAPLAGVPRLHPRVDEDAPLAGRAEGRIAPAPPGAFGLPVPEPDPRNRVVRHLRGVDDAGTSGRADAVRD
ncbi:MAG: hypothetical protein AAF772_14680, partial [Acidobacteriota bacterium]